MKFWAKGGWRFLFLALLGVAAIALAEFISVQFWHHIVSEVGIAILIAGILALAVDGYLKRELAKDAVEAALGYLLPQPLRDEMQWLHEQKVFCEKHHERISITPLDDAAVVVAVSYDRTLVNLSNEDCEIDIALAIDEWGHLVRKSAIRTFGYQIDSKRAEYEGDRLELDSSIPHVLRLHPTKVVLKPSHSVTVWGAYEEIQGRNGHHLMTYRYPTLRPRVEVAVHESFSVDVTFGHRAKFSPQRIGNNIWELNGLLLPTQYIRALWWPKQTVGAATRSAGEFKSTDGHPA